MPFLHSENYYLEFIKTIQKNMDDMDFEAIVWFGYFGSISLVMDILRTDDYKIEAIIDNDVNKKGMKILRNWCMPFTYNYFDINEKDVDKLLFGENVPDLFIQNANEFLCQIGENRSKYLFITNANRSEEIKNQLMSYGISQENILILPSEQVLWKKTYNKFEKICKKGHELSNEEHKSSLIDILDEFVAFCNKNNLRYYLAYGTLIGAVRHKGFIPWDDDIDILMPVEDYRILLNKFDSNSNYSVLSAENEDEYFFPFAKIVDNNTYLHHAGCPITWVQGSYIDIFPMSGFTKDEDITEQWKNQTLLDIKWYWYLSVRDILKKELPDCRREILDKKGKINFDSSDMVGVLTTIPAKPWTLDKSVFGDGQPLDFEGKKYIGPSNYDSYLKAVYGNYMVIPPIEERRNHGFPVFRRTQ